jgi:hypothetical protein
MAVAFQNYGLGEWLKLGNQWGVALLCMVT